MKKVILFSLLVVSPVFLGFRPVSPPELQMTDGYSVRFKGKKVNGFFHTLKGKIRFDENNLSASSFNMEIDVASISTGNSLKTRHAKNKKWFDAKKYPAITFNSSKITRTDKGYQVNGKLKMKDVEKDVTIPFKYVSNVFTGRFYVLRSDFKIGKMKGMHKAVGDTIFVDLTVPVVK